MFRQSIRNVSPLPLLALAAWALPGLPHLAAAPAVNGSPATVMGVRNGQELEVQVNQTLRRIRLACVQAPRQEQQPWFNQARAALQSQLPPGSAVTLELRARDVFGREVAIVRRNRNDVAIPLLRMGAVFAFNGYLGRCDDLGYPALEAQARARKLGVWSSPGGIERPWNLLNRIGDSDAEP